MTGILRLKCQTSGYVPSSVVCVWPVCLHGPAQYGLQVPGAAGEPVAQLLHKFLFAQAVNNRRNALRQAEEGEDDDGRQLFDVSLNEVAFEQNRQHVVDKVGQDVDGQLGAVQGDGPTPGSVAPVEHAEPPALHQYPHVAVQDDQRAHAYEDHLLVLVFLQLLSVTLPSVVVLPLEEQAERDHHGQQPGEHTQQPGPVGRGAGGRVAHRVAHGAEAVQSHGRERQEDVGGAADQDGDHGHAHGAARPRAAGALVVEDAAGAQVDQGGHQQVEQQHEAGMAAQPLFTDDSPVDDEVEEEEHREGHGGHVEAHAGVVPVRGVIR